MGDKRQRAMCWSNNAEKEHRLDFSLHFSGSDGSSLSAKCKNVLHQYTAVAYSEDRRVSSACEMLAV